MWNKLSGPALVASLALTACWDDAENSSDIRVTQLETEEKVTKTLHDQWDEENYSTPKVTKLPPYSKKECIREWMSELGESNLEFINSKVQEAQENLDALVANFDLGEYLRTRDEQWARESYLVWVNSLDSSTIAIGLRTDKSLDTFFEQDQWIEELSNEIIRQYEILSSFTSNQHREATRNREDAKEILDSCLEE